MRTDHADLVSEAEVSAHWLEWNDRAVSRIVHARRQTASYPMPLEPIDSPVKREADGFSFQMRVKGSQQIVSVIVTNDALDGIDVPPSGEAEYRSQFDKFRSEFEAVASEKHAHGRVTADGVVAITLADVVGFIE